jgi:hypothetical protein
MLTKCLQTTTAGMGTHKQRQHKTIQSRVRTMAVQATNEDGIHTIECGVNIHAQIRVRAVGTSMTKCQF